eukprot:15444386-Alexandrium_andersonii.AAC.1
MCRLPVSAPGTRVSALQIDWSVLRLLWSLEHPTHRGHIPLACRGAIASLSIVMAPIRCHRHISRDYI